MRFSCPFRTGVTACMEVECALWFETQECCSIAAIANLLTSMNDTLEAIQYRQNFGGER